MLAKLNPFRRIKDELEDELEDVVGKRDFDSFRQFAFKQSLIQTAVAFIIGSQFQKAVTAICDNLLMPIIHYCLSQSGRDWRTLSYSPVPGLSFGIGSFLGSFLDFIIAASILYLLYAKIWAPVFGSDPKIGCDDHKECAMCGTMIYYKATRCPNCTSWQ